MTALRTNTVRRGVSPIIATLMLVAITVVGGILIFVFSQGFFNTNQVSSTSAPEQLSIPSWNFTKSVATTTSGLTDVDGGQMFGIGSASATDTKLLAGDWVTFQLKNAGNVQVPISSVTINGIVYTFGGSTITGATVDTLTNCNITTNACFVLTTGATPLAGSVPGTGTTPPSLYAVSVVPAGKQVTVAVELNGNGYVPIKVGQTATITVKSGNGNTYLATATAGLSSG